MPTRITILVVDNEPSLRFLAVRILELAGHLVLSAETADEVKDIWRRVGRAIDLMVTGAMAPGLNGIDLAKELRLSRQDLKIIFVAGSIETDSAIAALGGETKVVYKPYTAATLREAVLAIFSEDDT
jgi:two-component system, cell cycle sensor histidine kinase and response regulator CckA